MKISSSFFCSRKGFSLVELLVVIAIIGILTGLALPAIQMVREGARRTACLNNLRQIGLSALNYESARRTLPPPTLGSGGFSTLGSSLVLLLPYVEQANRFDQYKLDESISSPANLPLTSRPLDIYSCPSMTFHNKEQFGEGSYIISYATNYRPSLSGLSANGAFADPPAAGQHYKLALAAFFDGTSNTFFFGEMDNSVRWTGTSTEPGVWGDYSWAQGYWFNSMSHIDGTFNQKGPVDEFQFREYRTFRSDHPAIVNFCFVDGSTRSIEESISKTVLTALVTRDGGEVIDEGY